VIRIFAMSSGALCEISYQPCHGRPAGRRQQGLRTRQRSAVAGRHPIAAKQRIANYGVSHSVIC
jgi:hypothetical protein